MARNATTAALSLPVTKSAAEASFAELVTLIFLQMIPATLLTPAIRPLFAAMHGGNEMAMHAFMSVNMLGAVLLVPALALFADRRRAGARMIAVCATVDAILLSALVLPIGVGPLLALRAVEGAMHVCTTTLLMAEAARIARMRREGRLMGLAGSAIIFAVAAGNALGGLAVQADPRAPFVLASLIAAVVAAWSLARRTVGACQGDEHPVGAPIDVRALVLPVSAAFVERFAIGCVIVTFALFAHRQHSITDGRIGALYSVMTLMFGFAMVPAGRLCDVRPKSAILASSALVYAGAIISLGWVPASALPLALAIAGVAAGGMYGPTLAYASVLAGSAARARSMALINAAGCLGMVAGPMTAGIVSSIVKAHHDPLVASRTVFAIAGGSALLWLLAMSGRLVRSYRSECA